MNKTPIVPETKRTIKDFLPLIAAVITILVFTMVMILYSGKSDLMFVMRMFMAGFFFVFGLMKTFKWRGFVMAYRKYDVIAKQSALYAYAYPVIELALGTAYVTGWNLVVTNSITLAVMLIGAIGVFQKLREKEEIPCACLGVVFKLPMTKVTLVEDLIMAAMAVWMLVIL